MKVGRRTLVVFVGGIIIPAMAVMGLRVLSPSVRAQERPAGESTSLQERINQRRAKARVVLTSLQQTRLRGRCQAGQRILEAYGKRAATIEKNRINAYDKIHDRLTQLIARLGSQADISQLRIAITLLEAEIEDFGDALHAYRQTLADLTEMNCQNDTTGFRASLVIAQQQQTKARQAAKAIRETIVKRIKPSLITIRQALQARQGEVIN